MAERIAANTNSLDRYTTRIRNLLSRMDNLYPRVKRLYLSGEVKGLWNLYYRNRFYSGRQTVANCRTYINQTINELNRVESYLASVDPLGFQKPVNNLISIETINDKGAKKGNLGDIINKAFFRGENPESFFGKILLELTGAHGLENRVSDNSLQSIFSAILKNVGAVTSQVSTLSGNKEQGLVGKAISAIGSVYANLTGDFENGCELAAINDDSDEGSMSWLAKFIGNDLKVKGSVFSGEKTGEGELWGISTAGAVSGAVLTGEAGIKTKASWKFKDKDGDWDFKSFGFATTASASGALAKGEVKGNVGLLHSEASGQFLTGAVKGEAKATLWDDGKFNPSLMLGAKAEGSVLQGEAKAGFGNDQYGIYGKAEGDILHAEAEAKAGVGYIGKDKDGYSLYGASAEASAMASVAQGKVKGGVTIFGIDIDVGVKGYAVAAGVEAGGSITTEGVTASFSGALGLGAGLDVSVDWSDAEWVEDTVEWIGDAGEAIGNFAVDTYEAAGDFLSNAGDAIADGWNYMFGWI